MLGAIQNDLDLTRRTGVRSMEESRRPASDFVPFLPAAFQRLEQEGCRVAENRLPQQDPLVTLTWRLKP
jgi:hypothetical protein